MKTIQIGVVMGSSSDWDTMQHAVDILQQFGIGFEARVVSAHRMPDDMFAYAEQASGRGLQALFVATRQHQRSNVQMPKGIPVATFAIGPAGAANAALFAVAMLAVNNEEMRKELEAFRRDQTQKAQSMTLPITGSAP